MLGALAAELRVATAEFEGYLQQEREYLRSRKAESPDVSHKLDYLAALHRLQDAGYVPTSGIMASLTSDLQA